MKKCIFLLGLLFIVSSCTYDLIQEITFHEDHTFDVKYTMDLSKSLQTEHKEMVISMVNGMIYSFINMIMDTISVDEDIISYEDFENIGTVNPVNYSVCLDTILLIQHDSIALGIRQFDSLHVLTEDEIQRLSGFIYEFAKKATVTFVSDISNQRMYIEFYFPDIRWDTLKETRIDEIYEKMVEESVIDNYEETLDQFRFSWDENRIVLGDFNLLDKGSNENNKIPSLEDVEKNSNIIIIHHFPGKVKKSVNSLYKKRDKGRTLIFNRTVYDISNKNLSGANEIIYLVK